jgi:hypothetical protein
MPVHVYPFNRLHMLSLFLDSRKLLWNMGSEGLLDLPRPGRDVLYNIFLEPFRTLEIVFPRKYWMIFMRSYDSAPRLASTAHLQLYLVFLFWTTPLREASSCFVSRACTLCTFYQEFRPMRMKNCAPPPPQMHLPHSLPILASWWLPSLKSCLCNLPILLCTNYMNDLLSRSGSRYKWSKMLDAIPYIQKPQKPNYLQTNFCTSTVAEVTYDLCR